MLVNLLIYSFLIRITAKAAFQQKKQKQFPSGAVFSFAWMEYKEELSGRERLTPVLSHHRTYGSVYGGSIKIIDASLYNFRE
ncbi:hypothetical protein N1I87_02925 [Bacillus sp. FSL W8-0102]|uniref:hypothetical protein n=1 Tax=Bacillus sp. FSL W8-0102 TaxID=2978205 RepID=UPI0030FC79B8